MKKMDIVIIAVLLMISFVPELLFGLNHSRDASNTYAEITISGKHYKTVPLSSNKGEDSFIVDSSLGTNVILIKDNSIAIIDADCPDKLCLEPGFVSKPGQAIVCLPNQLMVEVKGSTEDKNSDELDKVSH